MNQSLKSVFLLEIHGKKLLDFRTKKNHYGPTLRFHLFGCSNIIHIFGLYIGISVLWLTRAVVSILAANVASVASIASRALALIADPVRRAAIRARRAAVPIAGADVSCRAALQSALA